MGHDESTNGTAFQVRVVRSDLRSIGEPKEAILTELERHGYPDGDVFALKLALEEALTNAVKHGNANDPAKQVKVQYSVDDERAIVIVSDQGPGFMPEDVPDCTCAERLPVPNGRGIMLMKAYMDKICYRDKGREVYFMKRRSAEGCCTALPAAPAFANNVRRTVHYRGRVQGVGFRFNAESIASTYTVTGYVKNVPDGRVELVAEGEPAELDRFQQEVEQAMKDYIEHVDVAESPACGEYLSFRINR
jgi:serine/threonine-protein kinase RsbW